MYIVIIFSYFEYNTIHIIELKHDSLKLRKNIIDYFV